MKYLLSLSFTLSFITLFARNNAISFIENKGQIIDQNNHLNNAVKYIAYHNGIKLELKHNSFSYEILHIEKTKKRRIDYGSKNILKNLERMYHDFDDSTICFSHRIDVALLGANPNPELKAEGQLDEYLNYYTTGTPEAGVTYVHQFNKVTYQNIYPNIDLEFVLDVANKQPFKYNFIVKPGGRVADIQLRYNGANAVELNAQGSINITTAYGSFEESIPKSFLAETGNEVLVSYHQNHDGFFGFNVGNYNANQTLIIDPWCTYFGWEGSQQGLTGLASLTTDASRNIYTDGSVDIFTNIATTGAFQTVYGGDVRDAFIRKFNSSGIPIWCTYYGGSGEDRGGIIHCDELSCLFIVGFTLSPNNIATSGSFSPVFSIGSFSFLSKFNSSGIRQWGTYFSAFIIGMKLDGLNNIIITGGTSVDTGIATIGAHQTIFGGNGNSDAFVSKFTKDGVRLWGTYYGGTGEDRGDDISIDNSNNIYLSGVTESPNNISISGAFQSNYAGGSDNFITKFNSNGARQWGTYYGGNGVEDQFASIEYDNNGSVYFTGQAQSPNIFATPGAFQMGTSTWGGDCCLAKFNTNGQRIWSTYFDGNGDDWINDLKIDSHGNPVITGNTFSTDIIASPGCFQATNNGNQDDFFEKFDPSGNRIWGTYFGGTGGEIGAAITIDNQDNIIVSGNTFSKGLATLGAYETTLLDTLYGDIFLASLDSNGTFTTGFGEVANPRAPLLQVYPNPTKDKIVVHLKSYTGKESSLKLQTIEGKLLKQCSVKAEETSIDLKELAIGVYLLEYSDGVVCESVKVVKE